MPKPTALQRTVAAAVTRRLIQFDQPESLDGAQIDLEAGVIRGVSLITCGVQARGHDLHTDDITLSQLERCAVEMGQVPTKWNHRTGADAVNGYITNFRREGGKLKGDWHLLRAHSQFSHALELAQRMPQNVGLSCAFIGEPEKRGGTNFARCRELISVDLVATPAANPDGLFEAVVDRGNSPVMSKHNPSNPAESDISVQLQQILDGQTQLSNRLDKIEAFNRQVVEAAQEEADDDDEQLDDDDADGDDGDDFDGEGDSGGEGGEGGAMLSRFEHAITHLERRARRFDEAERDAATDHAFGVVREKIEAVVELNEELMVENRALNEQLSMFQARMSRAGVSPEEAGAVRLRVKGAARTDFEARVQELKAGGKKGAEAITLARAEDPQRYTRHLEEIGAVNRL